MFENSYQGSKPHFDVLDGLRGLAAVAVVIFHFMEIAVPDYHDSFIAHAYLSVDFFFCLSGFVIAYAYDQRIGRIGVLEFLKRRLIRLHPLVIIGSVIGLLVFVFDPFSNLYQLYADKTVGMFFCSCLMIPYPLVHERYFNLFHLNPPTWSLFWEYVANVVYVLVLVRIRPKVLWVLTVLAAGVLFFEAKRSGFLGVGWGGDNVAGGGIRVAFSFLAGVLIFRSGWRIRSGMGFIGTGLLLLLALVIPYRDRYNWVVDPLVVVFYFPLVIMLGAGTVTTGVVERVCKFSGEISYPLYMVHYPFIWLFMSYVEKYKPGIGEMTVVMMLGTVGLVGLAWVVLRYLDEPVRGWLNKKIYTF